MEYQQYFEQLKKNYAEKSDSFYKKDKEIAQINGFGDFRDLPEHARLKNEWEIASSDYFGLLSTVKEKNINPHDEVIY
jgi:hypothetical protein